MAETRFTHSETSQYPRMVTGILVVTVLELPLLHAILGWFDASWPWHLAVAALHFGVVVWIVRDWRAMKRSAHVLDADHLVIALGTRWSGRVPRTAIADARREQLELDNPLDGPPPGVARITPWDTPNVRIELGESTTIHGWHNRPFRADQLWLFVDDPDAFVDELSATVCDGERSD